MAVLERLWIREHVLYILLVNITVVRQSRRDANNMRVSFQGRESSKASIS